jgi:hypothetical protein
MNLTKIRLIYIEGVCFVRQVVYSSFEIVYILLRTVDTLAVLKATNFMREKVCSNIAPVLRLWCYLAHNVLNSGAGVLAKVLKSSGRMSVSSKTQSQP